MTTNERWTRNMTKTGGFPSSLYLRSLNQCHHTLCTTGCTVSVTEVNSVWGELTIHCTAPDQDFHRSLLPFPDSQSI